VGDCPSRWRLFDDRRRYLGSPHLWRGGNAREIWAVLHAETLADPIVDFDTFAGGPATQRSERLRNDKPATPRSPTMTSSTGEQWPFYLDRS